MTTTNWTPESEVDQATGASIKKRGRMAELLGISERQLDRLTLDGKLTMREDGYFLVRKTLDEFAEYRADKAFRPSKHDALREKQAEVIRRRLEREAVDLIDMPDALETIDHISAALLIGFDEIAAKSIAIAVDKERARAACGQVRGGLVEQFDKHRHALQYGKARP